VVAIVNSNIAVAVAAAIVKELTVSIIAIIAITVVVVLAIAIFLTEVPKLTIPFSLLLCAFVHSQKLRSHGELPDRRSFS